MTEAEWLASADPLAMLFPLSGVACTRKWRLFAIESFRHLPHQFDFPLLNEAVALAVAEVDGIGHRLAHVREEIDRASWELDAADPRTHLARTTHVMLSDSVKAIGAGRGVIYALADALETTRPRACGRGFAARLFALWRGR